VTPAPLAVRWGKATAVVGLVCGVVYSVGGFFYDLATIGLNFGTLLAFGALVGMPLIFGVVGLVLGALAALLARAAGGGAR
jgi:hypothetical protein